MVGGGLGGEHDGLPGDLRRVAERLAKWRGRRELGARIPESLWGAAVAMVGRHGLNRTAKSLHLDYYSLKQRVEEAAVVPSSAAGAVATAGALSAAAGVCPTSPAPFVELPASMLDPLALRAVPPAGSLPRDTSHDASGSALSCAAPLSSPNAPAPTAPRHCLIELIRATGGTLRIQLTNHDVPEIAALCRQLEGG